MSLRSRLVLSFTALLMLAVLLTVVVATSAVRAALSAQVDDALVEVARRGRAIDVRTLVGGDEVFPRNVAVVVIGPGGRLLRSTPSGFGDAPDALPDVDLLVERFEGLSTVPSEDGGFDYRVLVVRTPGDITVAWASPLYQVDRAARVVGRFLLFAGAIVLLLGIGATMWSVRRGLRPIDRMVETADAITGGDLSRRVDGADRETELGRLAAAFNEMLARIEGAKASDQESQDRLRRFVADASHELRTPLAAIGGYAELYRRGGLEDRAELDRAMARVESESARMHRLVEDLLLLARMDEGPQLTRERVNLIDTISGVVADHRAIDATRPVSIVAPQPATVEGDGARLAQVFANLLANVRTHTPEGTTVLIDIGVVGGEVSVEIVDDGPGIPADDADRVFDRFYRVDPSRSRQRGGSGLGLSIVSAIVAAHGGTVEAGSSGSGGARFMVRLPLAAGLGASGPVERVDGPG